MGLGDDLIGSGYWDHQLTTKERTVYKKGYRVKPGRLEIPHELELWAKSTGVTEDYVVLQPATLKKRLGWNKEWPWDRWQELSRRAGYPLVMSTFKGLALDGVALVNTPTPLHMAALINQARGIVTTEGYCHHVAGALKKPAVVLFGARTPPSVLGYKFHRNLAVDDPEAVGWMNPHPACRAAMERITVEDVLKAMRKAFP